jgi:chromosome segregation and condensation protein ScpB
MEDLSKKIEAILFYSSEPVSVNFLVKILEAKKEEVSQAITELKDKLSFLLFSSLYCLAK